VRLVPTPINVVFFSAFRISTFGRAVLNLCIGYSSRDEITMAVEEIVHDALLEGRTE
jgi:undecaprenyl pyrophosphate synthase